MTDQQIILMDLKNHLRNNYGQAIKEVILFGSQMRGDSKEYSDYDILIVIDEEYSGKEENMIMDLCYDIDLKHNILIDAHLISKKELQSIRGRQPIFANAIKLGIRA